MEVMETTSPVVMETEFKLISPEPAPTTSPVITAASSLSWIAAKAAVPVAPAVPLVIAAAVATPVFAAPNAVAAKVSVTSREAPDVVILITPPVVPVPTSIKSTIPLQAAFLALVVSVKAI
jgi:hypothetical protein